MCLRIEETWCARNRRCSECQWFHACFLYCFPGSKWYNVKSGLINTPLLINLLLPKKMQFKNRWSPQINKHPRLKNHQCWNPFFIQQFLLPILFISNYSPPARWGLLDFIRAVLLLLRLLLLVLLLLLAVQIPVGTAGPQPRVADRSGHCRTSTASSRSQWALPDLNRDFQIAVGTAGPQPRLPDRSGHCRTSTGRKDVR